MVIPQWPFGRGFMSQYKTRRSGGLRENLLWTCCDLSAPPVLICCLLPGPSPSSSSSSTGTSTMDSSGMLRGLLFVGLLFVICHGQASQEVSVEDFGDDKPEASTDKDLIEALEALLGRMHKPSSSTAEKRGSIPMCGMGERCVMKYGSRFGKLCDCSRGTTCNSYLLKCI
ncbi:cocaine- and amphetamine-regulated transcript protein [Morone saxatilis]|uniref:cocaine- and amphetamine-regulated transcript protein n=1 Tax=Morone saxatilis TaxID=34816 RepID=UPI0015E20734|nr:cocaine- and amphetamine-regulated transcript protein [Morone saxatilis]